jgi:hypothetical protein
LVYRAESLDQRSKLFVNLFEHENVEVRAWAKAQHKMLQEASRTHREWEMHHRRERSETFE